MKLLSISDWREYTFIFHWHDFLPLYHRMWQILLYPYSFPVEYACYTVHPLFHWKCGICSMILHRIPATMHLSTINIRWLEGKLHSSYWFICLRPRFPSVCPFGRWLLILNSHFCSKRFSCMSPSSPETNSIAWHQHWDTPIIVNCRTLLVITRWDRI